MAATGSLSVCRSYSNHATTALLHFGLQQLGLPIPDDELWAASFGPRTLGVVMDLQKSHGLPTTGAVDGQTGRLINAEVDKLNRPLQVHHPDGRVAAGVAVVATGASLALVLITNPLVSVPVAVGATTLALDVTKDVVLPGTELLVDWKKGGKEAAANGPHYILKLKG